MSGNLIRGQQLMRLGRWVEAEVCFREILAQNPDDTIALHMLAMSLNKQPGKRHIALDAVDRAIGLDPEDSNAHVLRAEILRAMRRLKESLAAAETAAGHDPDNAAAWCQQTLTLLSLNRRREAEEAARTAMALDPDNPSARAALAAALDARLATGENLELLRKALADDPQDDEIHTAMGRALLQRGAAREAEEHFAEAMRLDPANLFARNGLLEAMRARSFLYRWYLRLYFGIERTRRALPASGCLTFFGLGHLFGGVLHGTASFFLLFSSRIRPLMLLSEKMDAILTGLPALITFGSLIWAACGGGATAWKLAATAGLLAFFAGSQAAHTIPHNLRSDYTTHRRW